MGEKDIPKPVPQEIIAVQNSIDSRIHSTTLKLGYREAWDRFLDHSKNPIKTGVGLAIAARNPFELSRYVNDFMETIPQEFNGEFDIDAVQEIPKKEPKKVPGKSSYYANRDDEILIGRYLRTRLSAFKDASGRKPEQFFGAQVQVAALVSQLEYLKVGQPENALQPMQQNLPAIEAFAIELVRDDHDSKEAAQIPLPAPDTGLGGEIITKINNALTLYSVSSVEHKQKPTTETTVFTQPPQTPPDQQAS